MHPQTLHRPADEIGALSAATLGTAEATEALLSRQKDDGHWVFELEADVTIPAEYILLCHYLGEDIDPGLCQRLGDYIRGARTANGGWPLFHEGHMDLSASVKGYYALKACGDDIDAPHMVEARTAILRAGGAERANVFTRILLALFGQVPWRAVPTMPVEIMTLPRWSPFHLDRVSYWSRTVIVPLLVLMACKPQARNPKGIHVRELFNTPPQKVEDWHHHPEQAGWTRFFKLLDAAVRRAEPLLPADNRRRAIAKAVNWVEERLNGEDGLGAIYPAMANAVMMYDALGYSREHPSYMTARRSIEKLVVDRPGATYVQPCLSPVWDTALTVQALLEVNTPAAQDACIRGLDWLAERQILDTVGDWAVQRPNVKPGGWAFQYANPHYPDVDDTAVVVMAMHRADPVRYATAIERALHWIRGMQSENGGWGAFDADNTHHYLNYIPFADHGALLDPPTADVSARCVGMLAQLGTGPGDPVMDAGLRYLRREQEADGSWFGRWGTNYVYGTWSVLSAFNAAGIDAEDLTVRRAVQWLKDLQNEDGGWGESGATYWRERRHERCESTASQTAWAMLGLMAAGAVDDPSVARGAAYLAENQGEDGLWPEDPYTAVGFPRVFYLRYHGYPAFFPLMALARYKSLSEGNARTTSWGL
ncbi:squalene--hopene cyclase [Caenispirillum salinarum]|uniref:squalene--hopene cyclase n=1 Tax=Caenispirillum salinarum TaxID=859058 RepID=UPI00384F1D0F